MGKDFYFVLLFHAFLIMGISSIISCDSNKKHEGKTPVARVYDKFLYKEDLAKVIPTGLSKDDSILKVKSYIDFWVKRYAMTKTAELNLAEEQKDVAEELENYRMDLLIFRYKQIFIEQNLDTVVTQKQIMDFYQQHEKEFMLSQPAVRAVFIKILKTSPNLSMISNLYRSSRESDILQLKQYCEEHSAIFNTYNDDWIYFKDICIEIPIRIDDHELYLKTNTYIEAQDSAFIYFLNIKNYRLKDALAPLNFVEGNIQSMILKQRKQELLDVIENNVYNSMLDKKDIELFDNE
jgi:hypothetical protein